MYKRNSDVIHIGPEDMPEPRGQLPCVYIYATWRRQITHKTHPFP